MFVNAFCTWVDLNLNSPLISAFPQLLLTFFSSFSVIFLLVRKQQQPRGAVICPLPFHYVCTAGRCWNKGIPSVTEWGPAICPAGEAVIILYGWQCGLLSTAGRCVLYSSVECLASAVLGVLLPWPSLATTSCDRKEENKMSVSLPLVWNSPPDAFKTQSLRSCLCQFWKHICIKDSVPGPVLARYAYRKAVHHFDWLVTWRAFLGERAL